MINKPIKINDYKSPVESTREELIKESSNHNKKNFSFKGYVTEKERIVRCVKNLIYFFNKI